MGFGGRWTWDQIPTLLLNIILPPPFSCSKWLSGKKNLPAMQEMQVRSLGKEDLEKEMATRFNVLAWEIHAHRSLAGYSQWSLKELDTA